MEATELHIGAEIEKKVRSVGITDAEFARRINTTRQNVQSLYKRKSIDTEQLSNICQVLNYNFFEKYLTNLQQLPIDNSNGRVKVLVEIEVDSHEMLNLNLKDKILSVLNK